MDQTEQETSMPTEPRIDGLVRAAAHLRSAANDLREALAGLSRDDEDIREAITTIRPHLNRAHLDIYHRIMNLRNGDEPEPASVRPIPESEARYLARDSINIIEGAMCAFNAAVGKAWRGDPRQFDEEWREAWWTLYSTVPDLRREVLEAMTDRDPEPAEE